MAAEDGAALSGKENVSEIQALTLQVEQLSNAADFWNNLMLWGLAIAALAAVFIVVTTRLALARTSEAAEAQARLNVAKDREKDVRIAALVEQAEREKLARVRLQQQVAPRRLTGEQKAELTKTLKAYPDPIGVVIVSPLLDTEGSDFADDFDAAFGEKGANWKTVRLKDRLTQNTGISLGVYEGTPKLDPFGRPILQLKQRIADALTAVGIPSHDVTFGEGDLHSTARQFERGPIYLVIEHKPPIQIGEKQ